MSFFHKKMSQNCWATIMTNFLRAKKKWPSFQALITPFPHIPKHFAFNFLIIGEHFVLCKQSVIILSQKENSGAFTMF